MRFKTDYVYTDRETKARYVWEKYQQILVGKLLDVGSDEGFLRRYLARDTKYTGIGLGGTPDLRIDLEQDPIPFGSSSFDCVLCLDVLEHLDNLHAVFDSLCDITRRYLIISLPNPWADLYAVFYHSDYRPGQTTKFYGLPVEPPEDRHKWFFSSAEAEAFIRHRAKKNGMQILQLDVQEKPIKKKRGLRGVRPVVVPEFFRGPLWAVLEKPGEFSGAETD